MDFIVLLSQQVLIETLNPKPRDVNGVGSTGNFGFDIRGFAFLIMVKG